MKLLSITIASAAILAAASFGAQAQQQPREEKPGVSQGAPSQEGSGQRSQSSRPEPTQGAGSGRETQTQGGGNREAQTQSGDERPKAGERAGSGDKEKAAQQASPEKSGDKADRNADKSEGGMKKDTAQDQKPDSDRSKSADQQKGDSAKPERQASKEIKPEQRTVIKETIVKQNIRPERINVQIRVGVAVPRTVHLHPLPPTLIEIYPSYRSYKLVMVDDNTILVIDPDTWMIVDVIEV